MKPTYLKPMGVLALTGLLGLLAACSDRSVAGPRLAEPELRVQDAYPPYLTRYTLGYHEGSKLKSKTLLNRELGFCWLSGIGGKMHGTAGITQVGSSQKLARNSLATYVEAHCLEWSVLKTSKAKSVKWLSPAFTALNPVPQASCSYGVQDAWWGSSATFLTKLWGDWTVKGKVAFLGESNSGSIPSKVYAVGCEPSYLTLASATSMFFGVPKAGSVPHYYGPKSTNDVRGKAGIYVLKVTPQVSYQEKILAPADEAFCYLNLVEGQLDDAYDYINLSVVGGDWRLHVSLKGSSDLKTQVACYRLSQ